MKALFVGLGSIGTRHLKNLRKLSAQEKMELEITAWRSSERRIDPDIEALVDHQLFSLKDEQYDLAFITNPTQLHEETLRSLHGKATFFYIEKPIFANARSKPEGLELTAKNAYVAAPIRFTSVFQTLKEKLKEFQPYSVRSICSSYLPDWRPNQDYRKVYSAVKAQGGGVSIDLIHELDYLGALFGWPLETHRFCGKYSHLEIDSDDLSVYILKYPNLLCEVHLDYFGRTYRRTCECFCREGTITADFGKGTVTLPDGTVLDCTEEVNQRYEREIQYFLLLAAQKCENENPPETAYRTLQIALGE